jgi:alanyl-tRNA synthetase
MQEKNSNYDTDLFTGTIAEVERITGKKYTNTDDKKDIAFRVIADHIRAIAFTIADGQLPSNTSAGYVIRRILRRAVRYYYSYLDYKQPLLYELMAVLGKQFENVFPELNSQIEFVSKVVREEEEGFLRTLDKGIQRFEVGIEMLHFTSSNAQYFRKGWDTFSDNLPRKTIPGALAFSLYDTYGFPIDLTTLMGKEIGYEVDIEGFQKFLQEQKTRSRAATTIDTADWIVLNEGPTSEFLGYDMLQVKSKVLKYRKAMAKGKEAYQLVLNATPFYAESGGTGW